MRMRRTFPLALLLALAIPAAPAVAKVRPGPGGAVFYTAPSPLPGKIHGDAIWWRKLTGPALLKGARADRLLLYRSTGVDGKPTAESGTVAIPKGRAPKGGWPVITWGHGTTGIADTCAPSDSDVTRGYDHPLLQSWLKAGYAVVTTDFEGLGTPGAVHPYLIGRSEGRSMLDMVRAARQFDPRIGKRVVIAGHSQGGHAALWAASLAKRFTPELDVRGTVAFAPASHLREQADLLPNLTTPSRISALVSLILRGVEVANPSIQIAPLLSDSAAALYPQTLSECLPALEQPSSWGGLAPAGIFRQGADLTALQAAIGANDPEDLTIRTPVLLEQGVADTTVFKLFTDQLDQAYVKRHTNVTYKTYPGVDHGGVVRRGAKDARAFIKKAFR